MAVLQFSWSYLFFEGLILALLGVFALINPLVMSLSIEILLGSLLLVAGVVQGIRALKNIGDWNSVPLLIGAAFALIAGLILLTYPLTGVLTLTLILTAYFLIDGVSKMVTGWQYRAFKGWGWLFFSGLISVILALLIINGLPSTAVWVIGIYLGIYLLFLGSSLIGLSLYLKKALK